MKNRKFLLLVFLLNIGCEDVIELDLPPSKPQLVIDALIGYNDTNGQSVTAGEVKLTLTTPFFEETLPAENATVSLIDMATSQSYELVENKPGIFDSGFPKLEFNREYMLQISFEGEIYTATEQLVKSTIIEKLEQDHGFLFNEDETEVKVTFTDLPGERNHYLFAFGWNNYLVVDDQFFQDEQLTFSYFYEKLKPGKKISISVFGINKVFSNYIEKLLAQSGEDMGNGGPFAIPNATIRGNIVNKTNPGNFAFGYFALSEFDTQPLTIR
ncbi:DUF4249 family protein [Flagellimonas algicola]|uniref:DUF4249 family protein n=1 Tax=Flagellimonas algicola TaxID=2583815 RepID=UPI001386E49B|nr:DUF4249 family protein [Allomuricauda algicola]